MSLPKDFSYTPGSPHLLDGTHILSFHFQRPKSPIFSLPEQKCIYLGQVQISIKQEQEGLAQRIHMTLESKDHPIIQTGQGVSAQHSRQGPGEPEDAPLSGYCGRAGTSGMVDTLLCKIRVEC